MMYFLFFFFKQKTAYEMRISDWSSDVCSSDLWQRRAWCHISFHSGLQLRGFSRLRCRSGQCRAESAGFPQYHFEHSRFRQDPALGCFQHHNDQYRRCTDQEYFRISGYEGRSRSEEHTSELQSLMRISYAVFCLKKKKTIKSQKKKDTH